MRDSVPVKNEGTVGLPRSLAAWGQAGPEGHGRAQRGRCQETARDDVERAGPRRIESWWVETRVAGTGDLPAPGRTLSLDAEKPGRHPGGAAAARGAAVPN